MTPRHLSKTLWALGRLGARVKQCEWGDVRVTDVIDSVLSRCEFLLVKVNSRDLSNLVFGNGMFGRTRVREFVPRDH